MTRLLRHDLNIHREIDGTIKDEDIVEEFNKKKKKKFDGPSQWSLDDWISILAKEGGAEKRFQCCLNAHIVGICTPYCTSHTSADVVSTSQCHSLSRTPDHLSNASALAQVSKQARHTTLNISHGTGAW